MDKWDKEVLLSLLDSEDAAIDELKKQYTRALNDINKKLREFQTEIDMLDAAIQSDSIDPQQRGLLLLQRRSKIYQKQFQEALRGQVNGILETMHSTNYGTIEDYLKRSYEDAFVGTMYSLAAQGMPIIAPINQVSVVRAVLTDSKISKGLYTALGVDIAHLKKSIAAEISRGIATSLPYADIARNLENATKIGISNANRIVRTEGHRVQQAAVMDAQQEARARGADVVKQWSAVLDGRTRPTHRRLDGQVREIDEDFELDGRAIKAPAYFGDPAEDCNCRCTALTRSRRKMNDAYLAEMQERAAYWGLDKTKDFEDFKGRYLKTAVDYSNKMAKASIIEANGRFVNKTEQLYRFADKIKPLEGFEDFTCHADAESFYIDLGGVGKDEDLFRLTPEEYAERIKASPTYKGGNLRIISCQAGAKENGAAQRLANALNVNVYAPTETVHVTENGEIFLSDNDTLAEIWYNEIDRSKVKQTGEWVLFKPRKE